MLSTEPAKTSGGHGMAAIAIGGPNDQAIHGSALATLSVGDVVNVPGTVGHALTDGSRSGPGRRRKRWWALVREPDFSTDARGLVAAPLAVGIDLVVHHLYVAIGIQQNGRRGPWPASGRAGHIAQV
jgi:hypothetical protein